MMRCPHCQSTRLRVSVAFTGNVACAFADDDVELLEDVELESRWDESGTCQCLNCNWQGSLSAARGSPTDAVTTRVEAALKSGRFDCIRSRIARFHGEPRRVAQVMLKEIIRLSSLLQSISKLTQAPFGRSAADEDTLVG